LDKIIIGWCLVRCYKIKMNITKAILIVQKLIKNINVSENRKKKIKLLITISTIQLKSNLICVLR
jgi:hypothetical protein